MNQRLIENASKREINQLLLNYRLGNNLLIAMNHLVDEIKCAIDGI